MNSLGERVKKIRLNNKLSQEDFAEIVQSSRSNISRVEQNAVIPSADIITHICTNFNTDANWLLTGVNSFNNKDNQSSTIDKQILPIEEKILLNNYRKMTYEEKEKLQNMLIETRVNKANNHDENILLEDFRDMSIEEQEQFKKVAAKILASDKKNKKLATSKNTKEEEVATKEDKIA